ncbi:ABC transporter permease [Agrobacterium sp. SHOUNA12C]|uniref:Peptide ABC transporter n=2 Tax=Rhizobium rhizogenes TaxID=359 RepID=B9JL80_RHIR8|nr:ABC transporter permease [Rhizobium rhizogenes]ACM30672.1 peptide ABC transporter [Rhizobium rhizogenes K84]KAA6488849.1 ABC transporter permease [Agrobacterium sp. ICMP 7243]MCJ9725399.1 ABC transporter permease [Agrobacterium sp. BETTINA12B]MCJ9755762.1 ABC transporter permease [Agrobacterium sp. SHOUNA12C]OCJ01545.1 ABC transporter permease [Agrobacterium sp. 13-626]OCJ16010.1 ABC transporter permease [Agrobacterium sp. B131/95]OCJ19258.1 ABC transporter permease [Agrobacterium sp. B13
MRNLPRLTPLAVIGLTGLLIFLIMAVLAPWIAPHPVSQVVGGVWDMPSADALLGTDNIGRDLFSRLLWGARITFVIAALATVLAFVIGVSLGFYAAVRRGIIDQVLSRLNDLAMAIPTLILALVVLAVLPKTMIVLILVMAGLDATRVFRVSRALASDLVTLDYVEVARLRGEGWGWIIFREILPNALSPLLAEFGLRFAFAILFLSTLSFLGLGVQPPIADWGSLVKENKDGLVFGVFAALIPGAAIAILVICVNLVVDWMLQKTTSLKGVRRHG